LSAVLLSVCLSVNFYIFDFFSKTTKPILSRLGTNHSWGEGILNCSNEGDCFSPRGDNSKIVKNSEILKNLLLQNQLANFNQTWHKSSLGEGDSKLFKIKGQVLFKGEIISKMQKWGESFKNLLLQNHLARISHIYINAL
jgi:hypothetical protein